MGLVLLRPEALAQEQGVTEEEAPLTVSLQGLHAGLLFTLCAQNVGLAGSEVLVSRE